MKSAMPCRRCGKGVKVDYRLCRNCGGDSLRHVLKRKEIKAARNFSLVLEEIKKIKNHNLKKYYPYLYILNSLVLEEIKKVKNHI